MDIDVNVEIKELLDNSAARHKIAIKPKRNYPEKQRYTWFWNVYTLVWETLIFFKFSYYW